MISVSVTAKVDEHMSAEREFCDKDGLQSHIVGYFNLSLGLILLFQRLGAQDIGYTATGVNRS